jgi:hypothetical protein
MGLYSNPALLEKFIVLYANAVGRKPDMGKSCIRFAYPARLPFLFSTTTAFLRGFMVASPEEEGGNKWDGLRRRCLAHVLDHDFLRKMLLTRA